MKERAQGLLWAPRDSHPPPDAVRAPAPVMNVPNSETGFKASGTGSSKLRLPGLLGFTISLAALVTGEHESAHPLIIVLAFEKHSNTSPSLGALASFLPTPKLSENQR